MGKMRQCGNGAMKCLNLEMAQCANAERVIAERAIASDISAFTHFGIPAFHCPIAPLPHCLIA
jgi:hypothetical protein